MSQNPVLDPPAQSVPNPRVPTLRQRLQRSEFAKTRRSLLLIAPLLVFVVVCFLFPIGSILSMSVNNPELPEALPQTSKALQQWSGEALPDERVYALLAKELIAARDQGQISSVAKRLSYEDASYRRLILAVPRIAPADGVDVKNTMMAKQPLWGDLTTWRTLQRAAKPFTSLYLLSVFDRKVDAKTGDIVSQPADQALYVNVLLRTLWMATVVTLLCVGIGYPLAYWLAKQPSGRANLLMILVLLPFWTSLIVRTASWIVLLQSGGLINRALMGVGIIDHPLTLVFNRLGVYISMTHILLPFIVLPLYAVMKGISPSYMRAAISLGAHPFLAFWRVYVPQTFAGITAGALLVFMMAIGYYVTPALLGGPDDQMVSYFVAFFTNSTMNWGMAAALGSQLLIIVMLLYIVYIRVTRTSAEAAAR
ncbi:ABC transporter permease [Pantoea cypripedii]|uniref:Polyamine ABC transporter substrate-binding protein n=1 Tax=Pantoea cypripedii TaxID=55209 RepID=A0A1X1EWZ6_PANCY|nr:ABC transporter permease [Pantoea cypripedii]MBP2198508.1 putative spermidine/putrescine transport system permease protein [Pantoea cypripedii]ORM94305.1 polyamine ABC transporter substrate-binding protein [Pantoea cypripedii]